MDFVEWCNLVLQRINKLSQVSPNDRLRGVHVETLMRSFFGEHADPYSEFRQSTQCQGVLDAIRELGKLGFIDQKGGFFRITLAGKETAADPIPLWELTCAVRLEQEHQQLLHLVNRLSPKSAADHAWLDQADGALVPTKLGWEGGTYAVWLVARELKERGFVNWAPPSRSLDLMASYQGLVWETRRGFLFESKRIDELVKEWETTSVDFKRELYLDTADQKAEFIKDIIGLANTPVSGRRLLIIGFDNKTREYYGPPHAKLTQDRMEQILSRYTSPAVSIRYTTIDYRSGLVGQVEVLREPQKLPYRVAKSTGDKKRIVEGQIFVRHGSQTEEPTPDEHKALLEEGERARTAS